MGQIADAIKEFKQPRPGFQCTFCRALSLMDEKDRAAIEAELNKDVNDPTRIPDGGIAKIMSDAGFYMQRITVLRHRRRECVQR